MVGLLIIMRIRLGGLEGSRISSGLFKALLSVTLMGGGIWAWSALAENLTPWAFTLGGILVAILIYGAGLVILKTEEISQIAGALKNRFNKN